MNSSANISKKISDFPIKISHFSVSQEVRPDSVRFGKTLLLFYAGRAPNLRHKESGRRFFSRFLVPKPRLGNEGRQKCNFCTPEIYAEMQKCNFCTPEIYAEMQKCNFCTPEIYAEMQKCNFCTPEFMRKCKNAIFALRKKMREGKNAIFALGKKNAGKLLQQVLNS